MLKLKQIVRENTTPHKMATKELSGVTYILIIGGGVLMFVLLFIFAKRQIMRFAIRSRRGPHVPVGMLSEITSIFCNPCEKNFIFRMPADFLLYFYYSQGMMRLNQ